MAERYIKLFSLPDWLYFDGAPCVIKAGALLKDTETGSVLAQLKFQSITPQTIKMLKVAVTTYDGAGQVLESNVEYRYTGLDIRRDNIFGDQVPLVLKNSQAVSFKAVVCEVFFADATTWKIESDTEWKSLTGLAALSKALNDNRELVEEYKRKFGAFSKCWPRQEKNIWFCSCGAINCNDEETCHNCNNNLQEMLAVTPENLRAEREERLQKEKEEREKRQEKLEEQAMKTKKVLKIVLPIVCVAVAVIIVLTTFIIPTVKYNHAQKLFEDEKYAEAVKAFNNIDYKDSADKIVQVKEAWMQAQLNSIKNLSIGDEVAFGFYEQDNNEENDKEEIEWEVLNVKEDKALLISKYSLDCQQYEKSDKYGTWKTSTLRKWLNEDFYNAAFGMELKEKILSTNILVNDDFLLMSPEYKNEIQDKIFALSIQELDIYFPERDKSLCNVTNYARVQCEDNIYDEDFNYDEPIIWWLRSPDSVSNIDEWVAFCALPFDGNHNIFNCYRMVRPAMWVQID